jgi:hypothetical protein
MFDQFDLTPRSTDRLRAFWAPFQGSKVLSFSTAVHVLATAFGIVSYQARYYPEPAIPARIIDGLHGFLWIRRERELGWQLVRSLVGDTEFNSFHIHLAGDPGFPPVQVPSAEDIASYHITTSRWFDQRADFEAVVERANVFFAPRLAEGIGQSFLEAMGRGQCVVAADNPTMNEYIVHGVNGLLYDPGRPSPLDFSDVPRSGENARCGMISGRSRWEAMEQAVVDYILTPSSTLYGGTIFRPRNLVGEIRERAPSRLKHLVGAMSRTLSPGLRRRAVR